MFDYFIKIERNKEAVASQYLKEGLRIVVISYIQSRCAVTWQKYVQITTNFGEGLTTTQSFQQNSFIEAGIISPGHRDWITQNIATRLPSLNKIQYNSFFVSSRSIPHTIPSQSDGKINNWELHFFIRLTGHNPTTQKQEELWIAP